MTNTTLNDKTEAVTCIPPWDIKQMGRRGGNADNYRRNCDSTVLARVSSTSKLKYCMTLHSS